MRRLVREGCDELVSIPASGRMTTLNVASAAAVIMYEVARQREGERN
jgi:23S rRNA (guanosine2251-2'-O)-methyltransferase